MPTNKAKPDTDGQIPPAAKAIAVAMLVPMSLVPIGVGLTVIGFLWFSTDQFGGPPLFFKVFGSFIALAFISFGAIPLVAAAFGGGLAAGPREKLRSAREAEQSGPARTFICPHCSAPLTDLADIPASGEVQCTFCHGLFNVRAG